MGIGFHWWWGGVQSGEMVSLQQAFPSFSHEYGIDNLFFIVNYCQFSLFVLFTFDAFLIILFN